MADILLVEDNATLVLTLKDRLQKAGHSVTVQRDGGSGLEAALSGTFDCIVLDVNLPKKDGYQVCRELRRRNVKTPIVMLSARNHVFDRVEGLKLGADDYLGKPFEMVELLARVDALLRRQPPLSTRPAQNYTFGDITVDTFAGEIRRGKERIEVTDLEVRLISYLLERRGSAVTRDELLANVWNLEDLPLTRTVDMKIAALRQKLEADPSRPTIIVTVHGVGYKIMS